MKTFSTLIDDSDLLAVSNEELTYREINLVPLSEAINNPDIQSHYRHWFNNPKVTKFNSHGLFPYDPTTDINEFLKDKSRLIWAIISIPSKGLVQHIGNVSLQSINLFNRSAELACVIGETKYWGNGIMTWASRCIIKHGFDTFGLNRIWSGTSALNIGMQKVFYKLGFRQEGCFREGQFIDGRFVNVLVFALLRSVYKELLLCKEWQWDGVTEDEKINEDEDEILINKMQAIRSKNNVNWMDLVGLAFKGDREKAEAIMGQIDSCDKEIGKVSRQLSQ